MISTAVQQNEDISQLLAARTKARWANRYAFKFGATVFLVSTVILGYFILRGAGTPGAEHYRTEPVTRGDLAVTVSATGNLQPRNKVDVGSELSGIVEAVFVQENDRVKKGQVLARLDEAKLKDQITKSRATLASAEAKAAQSAATVKETATNLERLRQVSRISGGKVPSKAEMETAEATLARAQADQLSLAASINEARASLSSDETNLAKASIRSPIDGVVLTRSVEPGQTVAASLQVATLFIIAEDLQQMELKVYVDEADVGSVGMGQSATFTVDAYPGRKYAASVSRVAYGSQTKDNVVSYPTVLKVNNDDLSLRPGMTATAEIATTQRKNATLVPNAALRFIPPAPVQPQLKRGIVASLLPGPPPGNSSQAAPAQPKGKTQQVWTIRDHRLVPIPVNLGLTNGRLTEVTGGGLQEGMQLVTESVAAQK